MNIDVFIQNIALFCVKKGEKPTPACVNAGVGKDFYTNLKKGQLPSIGKVCELANYLGVTTSELLGETASCVPKSGTGPPAVLGLNDSAIRLKVDEVDMILAYRRASDDDRVIVDAALRKYKKKETATGAG